ncbi:MAG: glucosamine-6-phosphate deaminase [Bacillota bacterium]|jgi:glucosamine-6-phosphate deaminase|nr:glucosamine-6-phosphate deaminase [Bacillota bacterium]
MLKEMQFDNITVKVFQDAVELGRAAAQETSQYLKGLGKAPINLLFSTGASQFTFMDGLKEQEIAWDRIHAYHLDEYKNISPEHPASFRLWIRQRIEEALRPQKVEYIHGDAPSAQGECERYARLLENNPIDLGFIGIGENGHIAFNDPPVADFEDPLLVKVVELDEACRRQQLGEGWFATLEDVPKEALTVTIPGIMRCKKIICVVPDERKAIAVRDALKGPISTACPASILRTHSDVTLYLDRSSASLIL